MHIRSTVHPGQRGAKKLLTQYGDRLVCVRYRYDEHRQKRLKTVELIVEEEPWTPLAAAPPADVLVPIRDRPVGSDATPAGQTIGRTVGPTTAGLGSALRAGSRFRLSGANQ